MKYGKKIGKLKLSISKNKEDTAQLIADDISLKLSTLGNKEERDVLFLASGGSAFSVLDRIRDEVIGPHLTIGMLDERYDPTNKQTNYSQLRKTAFYKKAIKNGCRLIDSSTKDSQTMEGLAMHIETEIRDWMTRHPKGLIVVTLGIGPDGHTAGIMPFPGDSKKFKELFEGERYVVAYDAKNKNQYPIRATVTLSFLRKVHLVGVFVVGEEKKNIFAEVVANMDYAQYPASIIHEFVHGGIYVDESIVGIQNSKK